MRGEEEVTVVAPTPVAEDIFQRRYKWRDESFDGMIARTAKHIALAEKKSERSKYEAEFYELLSSLRFLTNSPTLFNAGTGQGLLSACFHFVVEDSLVSIMECHRLAGLVMKYGGGVGYTLSHIRPEGSLIKTVQGRACGPAALLPYYNEVAKLITQGGKRSGAQMAILDIEHENALDFITYKNENPDELSTFNISCSITNGFMERYKAGDPEAKAKIRAIAESTWKTGDPGVFFIDHANADNPTPWLGRLEGTNPCGEVPLLHAEACNLGSLNLAKYHDGTVINWDRLGKDTKIAVRMLDNIITVNDFPDPVITKAVAKTRKIGLGIMGWADMLALNRLHYDTREAVELGATVMNFVSTIADEASEAWQTYANWDDGGQDGGGHANEQGYGKAEG